ncbi:polyprenyl synthetase family protein [Streptacidiphilus sp. P02-A3a]|uniref:polyprenyl synthetase family protein n=1 Tax=Streptacidiphilus sp. P02-A3a TaxID=2704468 RepID=UPI0015F8D498|nr:polyprenyl synthetase family protein [Streptacidiphilus sp. P02-A3a]QMU69792.1 polyprenyl synthetase family protein [Streptacidiphilus sp. P02-A3a]
MTTTLPLLADVESETLAAELRTQLATVDAMIDRAADSKNALFSGNTKHLANATGQRVRPVLLLLAARFGQADNEAVVPCAVACELAHIAARCHEDIAEEETGAVVPAAARWANSSVILTGDYLFLQAARIGLTMSEEVSAVYTAAVTRQVIGQLAQTVGPLPGEDALDHYRRAVADKTAGLTEACCRLGALLSGADTPVADALAAYGRHIGTALHFTGDLLDTASGATLREGSRPLPVLHARACAGDADSRLLRLLDADLSNDREQLAEALELLHAHQAMDRARADQRQHVEAAIEALAPLPEVPAKQALQQVAKNILAWAD